MGRNRGRWIDPLRNLRDPRTLCLMFDTRNCLNRSTPFPAPSAVVRGEQIPDDVGRTTRLLLSPTRRRRHTHTYKQKQSKAQKDAGDKGLSTSPSSPSYLPYLLTGTARPRRPTFPLAGGRGTKRRDRRKSWLCWRADTDLLISDTDQQKETKDWLSDRQ